MNPPIPPATFPPAAQARRILYAEDMHQLRELMSQVLSEEGYRVETVGDGAQALELLTNSLSAYDLLITDHHMPVMNGLELVRQLRLRPYAGKIVVFSSELSEAVHDQYRRLAVDLVLPKPIFPLTFCRMLEQLFTPGDPARGLEPSASRSPHGPD